MKKDYFRELILSIKWLKTIYLKYRIKNTKDLMTLSELNIYLEEAEKVLLDSNKLPQGFRVGLVRDDDTYAKEELYKERSYYPKYERFLKNNKINYEYYNPFLSNWIQEARKFDLIIWHTDSDPSTQEIAEGKIYILEQMKIKCFPSFDEVWSYENKIRMNYLYELYTLPSIPTFISHSKEEAIKYAEQAEYPIISKISTGSASFGVAKINNLLQAKKIINEVFSYKGRETYFKYSSQKNYVYFQKFIRDATFDLRVICVGTSLFGYYRYPNKGDFRASGAGNYEKKSIPNEVLELAYQVKENFGSNFLATDFVYSELERKYYIIESSVFIGVDTCEQLSIDGIAGRYTRLGANSFEFEVGKFWVQELTLKVLVEKLFNE